MLDSNILLLIDEIHRTRLLDGRFTNMQVVNVDTSTGTRRGCFSVVFRADDVATGKPVALKFYDPSPAATADQYRAAGFLRESDLLQSLLNKRRCLQLERSLNTFNLSVTSAAGTLVLPCKYFAVEWLHEEIDHHFLKNPPGDPLDIAAAKLELFLHIVLAVQALHANEIFHRDLKQDNLRATERELKRLIVAIDLGTAARCDSGYINAAYPNATVGAVHYSAPEAICGLTRNRLVGKYTDLYALGCLLFELFNRDHYFYAVQLVNRDLGLRLAVMANEVTERNDEQVQLHQWNESLGRHAAGVSPIKISSIGHVVPPGITPLINDVLVALTAFDYRRRNVGYEWIVARIQIALKTLRNEDLYQRRLKAVRERRRLRLEKIRARDARSAQRLLAGGQKC